MPHRTGNTSGHGVVIRSCSQQWLSHLYSSRCSVQFEFQQLRTKIVVEENLVFLFFFLTDCSIRQELYLGQVVRFSVSVTMGKEKSEPETESMGYKDKAKAVHTLECLDGRDVSYQFRAITHYHRSAKKILRITKDQEKVKNIREAIEVFDEWLSEYKDNDRGKTNMSYLPIETLEALRPLAKIYGPLDEEFYNTYKQVRGDYKALRTTRIADGSTTWDIERNKRLKEIRNDVETRNVEWYETEEDARKGYPSKEHVRCIFLGYSPEPSKLKALIPKISEEFELSPGEEKTSVDEVRNDKGKKRSRDDSSSDESSVDEEPARKTPKKSPKPEKQEERGSPLGFKDKEKALKSIESLEGRDVAYQYHAIAGLVKRAGRVISCTKDEKKIKNIKEAVEIFERWLTDYDVNHRSRENFGYLTLDIVRAYRPLAEEHGIEIPGFLKAYEEVDGDYKKLRSAKVPEGHTTWDIVRNKELRPIVKEIKDRYIQWFETDEHLRGLPTKEHTLCIMWGFSHEPAKLKKILPLLKEKLAHVD